MDVLRLDPITYLPDSLVEGYTSLIWTERQLENGEFEMRTAKVEETRNLIPENSLITHLDTNEIMIVETHTIEKDEDGKAQLTVKGRTLETFAEDRALIPEKYGEQWVAPQLYNTADICLLLLWNNFVNATGNDPTRNGMTLDPRSVIPNLVVTDSTVNITEAPKAWYLDPADLYSKLKDFLGLIPDLGIRTIRPNHTSGEVVTVDTTVNTSTRGVITKVETADIQEIRFDIYQGVDRSRNQSVYPPIVFRYDSSHIEDPSYLFSIKGYKNLAISESALNVYEVWADTGLTPPDPVPTGLGLRILYLDDSDQAPERPVYPTMESTAPDASQEDIDAAQNAYDQAVSEYYQKKATYDQDVLNFNQSQIQQAQIELAKHNRAVLFDGAISTLAPYKYNEDYFLGDTVTIWAEYGVEEKMRVSEFVRTEDRDGDRGYPTLVLVP